MGSASVWRAAASLKSESKHVSLESGESQAACQEETAYGPGESRAYRHLYICIGESLNLVATERTEVEDLSDATATCFVGTRKWFSRYGVLRLKRPARGRTVFGIVSISFHVSTISEPIYALAAINPRGREKVPIAALAGRPSTTKCRTQKSEVAMQTDQSPKRLHTVHTFARTEIMHAPPE